MLTSDKKMLELKEILKSEGVIRFDKDFCDQIGILKQNLYKIENPDKTKQPHHFTTEQIEKAGISFSANMNFIFGFSTEPFINKASANNLSCNTKSNIK